MTFTIKDWIRLLELKYEQHQTLELDHKDCKQLADLLRLANDI